MNDPIPWKRIIWYGLVFLWVASLAGIYLLTRYWILAQFEKQKNEIRIIELVETNKVIHHKIVTIEKTNQVWVKSNAVIEKRIDGASDILDAKSIEDAIRLYRL